MVVSIGTVAAPSQGVTYYERDGYYARDDPAHREASAWAGKGTEALGLSGPVDPDVFKAVLEGKVPNGPRLGRPEKDGSVNHRPGRDLTFSAPKSVSLAALIACQDQLIDSAVVQDRVLGVAGIFPDPVELLLASFLDHLVTLQGREEVDAAIHAFDLSNDSGGKRR